MAVRNSRVAIVTGGGTGIGRAIAESFARAGDSVVIFGRREEILKAAAEAIGLRADYRRVDVGVRSQVAEAVSSVAFQYGRIDILVNNAGATSDVRAITTATPIDEAEFGWDMVLDSSLKGAFLMALAAVPHLPRPGGRT